MSRWIFLFMSQSLSSCFLFIFYIFFSVFSRFSFPFFSRFLPEDSFYLRFSHSRVFQFVRWLSWGLRCSCHTVHYEVWNECVFFSEKSPVVYNCQFNVFSVSCYYSPQPGRSGHQKRVQKTKREDRSKTEAKWSPWVCVGRGGWAGRAAWPAWPVLAWPGLAVTPLCSVLLGWWQSPPPCPSGPGSQTWSCPGRRRRWRHWERKIWMESMTVL